MRNVMRGVTYCKQGPRCIVFHFRRVCAPSGHFYVIMEGFDSLYQMNLPGFSKKRCTSNSDECVKFTMCQAGHHGGELSLGESCIQCHAGKKNRRVVSTGKSGNFSIITQNDEFKLIFMARILVKRQDPIKELDTRPSLPSPPSSPLIFPSIEMATNTNQRRDPKYPSRSDAVAES